MKNFFNNQVDSSQMATVANNDFSVVPTLMEGFGIFPKYKISPSCSVIVEYEPRGGFVGWIFSFINYFRPDSTLKVFEPDSKCIQWKGLFPWRYTLGYKVYGCHIKRERTDKFSICHKAYIGGITRSFNYKVFISAEIDPETFYVYMKEYPTKLHDTIENAANDLISKELKNRLGNPEFLLHKNEEDFSQNDVKTLKQAGYHLLDCRIQND